MLSISLVPKENCVLPVFSSRILHGDWNANAHTVCKHQLIYVTLHVQKYLLVPNVHWYNWVPTLPIKNTVCHLMMTVRVQLQNRSYTERDANSGANESLTLASIPVLVPGLCLVQPQKEKEPGWGERIEKLLSPALDNKPLIQLTNITWVTTVCTVPALRGPQALQGHTVGQGPQAERYKQKGWGCQFWNQALLCFHFYMAQGVLKETVGLFPPHPHPWNVSANV